MTLIFTLFLFEVCCALTLPENSSLLSRPSASSPSLISPVDNATASPEIWPPTPWVHPYSDNLITFYTYGRSADSSLEYEIVTGVQDIYNQMQHIPVNDTLVLRSENVVFWFVVRSGHTMTREQIRLVLVEMQVLYLNHFLGPREIVRAEVQLWGTSGPDAAFAIAFTKIDGPAGHSLLSTNASAPSKGSSSRKNGTIQRV